MNEEISMYDFIGNKLIYIVGALLLGIVSIWFVFRKPVEDKEKEEEKPVKKTEKRPSVKKEPKQKIKQVESPLKVVSLKGHTKPLTSAIYSPSGKYVATTSEDRTLRIFHTNTFNEKTPNVTRINLPLDSATASTFSADGNHILLALSNNREVLAYRLSSKKDEDGKTYKEVYKFPTSHQNQIKCIQLSSNSKVIITCTEDTVVYLWGLKGAKLEEINTNQMRVNMACISPDSRFISVAAWTGDVRIWEIKYNKENQDYAGVSKVMELKGHKSAVHCVDFSQNSGRVATTSKDGTFKIWKTDIRYQIGVEPECILTVPAEPSHPFNLIAFSTDSKTLAVTSGNNLYFYTLEGKLVGSIQAEHTTPIISISWSPDSKTIVTGGESHATVWKNPNM